MFAGNGDGLPDRQISCAAPLASCHPRPRFLAPENAELEGAPTTDASEVAARKLLVILELKPVDEAIFAPVGVQCIQERFAVEARQLIWPEVPTERYKELVQLGTGQQLSIGVHLLITLLNSLLH